MPANQNMINENDAKKFSSVFICVGMAVRMYVYIIFI